MAYTAPTVEDFKRRYPAFDTVADATVQAWLDEGDDETINFPDETRPRGVMLYAAHQLSLVDAIPEGVTSFKSGTFSASISDAQAARTGWRTTIYGRDYLALARRYFAGPRLAWTPPTHV